ncbi:hypothetical protein L596_020969 [Steinernema carpocapsae]|uniref:Uncharacterized protein n=1 Tax=Steinernema carpocapsae TaxID=34508 RepID=A0A4U5MV31_STECR|nr:hypothetical protein L596_020969 [Steinernema carpocapsae]
MTNQVFIVWRNPDWRNNSKSRRAQDENNPNGAIRPKPNTIKTKREIAHLALAFELICIGKSQFSCPN